MAPPRGCGRGPDRGGSNCLHVGRRRRAGDRDFVVVLVEHHALVDDDHAAAHDDHPADDDPPDHAAPTTTTAPPPPDNSVLRRGTEDPFVGLLEAQLRDLGFRPGDVDNSYTDATFAAVMAFQKYEGISADGHAGPQTMAALADGLTGAGPREGSTPRIEIDVERQIAFAVAGDGSTQIINISSGNGKRYDRPQGGVGVADTPRGSYDIERRIDGVRVAPLGRLYRPLYFKGGFAIHGSNNVPGYPASHGCVRTTNPDQDFLWGAFENGTPVEIYPA